MMSVPPSALRQLRLKAGEDVELELSEGNLIVKPMRPARKAYAMEDLLAASDYGITQPPEEREWVDAPAVGGELL